MQVSPCAGAVNRVEDRVRVGAIPVVEAEQSGEIGGFEPQTVVGFEEQGESVIHGTRA